MTEPILFRVFFADFVLILFEKKIGHSNCHYCNAEIGQGQENELTIQPEDAVKQERDFTASILRWIESIVVVIDLDGCVITFNEAAERCSGYTLEEVRQKPFWEVLIPFEERDLVKEVILNVKTEGLPIENENIWVTKDGETIDSMV